MENMVFEKTFSLHHMCKFAQSKTSEIIFLIMSGNLEIIVKCLKAKVDGDIVCKIGLFNNSQTE